MPDHDDLTETLKYVSQKRLKPAALRAQLRKPSSESPIKRKRATITETDFGRALYAKGWNMADVADRWGYSKGYLYRLAQSDNQSTIWHDALRGLPEFDAEEPEPDLQSSRLESVQALIQSLRNESPSDLRIHVFDLTGQLALKGAITYAPNVDQGHGLTRFPSGDRFQAINIEPLVETLAALALIDSQQQVNSIRLILQRFQKNCLSDQTPQSDNGLAVLLETIKASIFQDERHQVYALALGVSQQLHAYSPVYDQFPSLEPTEQDAFFQHSHEAMMALRQQARQVIISMEKVVSQASSYAAIDLHLRARLAYHLQTLLDMNLFRPKPIKVSASAKLCRYDLSGLPHEQQRAFTLFRAYEIFAESDQHNLIFLDDTPVVLGTKYKNLMKQINQHFD